MIKAVFSSAVVEAIGWALLHSLWQGTLLAVVLGILLVFLRQFSSQTRYVIIALFMGLMVVILPLTIIRQYQPTAPEHTMVNSAAEVNTTANQTFSASVRKQPAPATENRVTKVQDRFISYFEKHLPLIVTLWLMGILVLLLRYLGQLAYVQRLKH